METVVAETTSAAASSKPPTKVRRVSARALAVILRFVTEAEAGPRLNHNRRRTAASSASAKPAPPPSRSRPGDVESSDDEAEPLSTLAREPADIAVIDVRGSDRPQWGWIPTAIHSSSTTLTRQTLASLILDPAGPAYGKKAVVFHCLHSQHRAVWAADECLRLLRQHFVKTASSMAVAAVPHPRVYLLHGGFREWLDTWKNHAAFERAIAGTPPEKLDRMRAVAGWKLDRERARAAGVVVGASRPSSAALSAIAGNAAAESAHERDVEDSEASAVP